MSSPFRSAVVIANPVAGSGRRRLDGAAAAVLLRERGITPQVRLTRGWGGARDLAAAAAADGCELVVAVGGDGTVSEVAGALAGTRSVLGVLPAGSGNDFAAGIGCATVAAGLAAICGGVTSSLDVGALDGRPFVNSLGLLGSGEISGRAARLWRRLGSWRYVLAAAGVLLSYRGAELAWRCDDEDAGTDPFAAGRFLMAEICNGPLTGGGFRLAPDAAAGDGLLDLVRIRPLGAAAGLRLLPAAAAGRRIEHPRVGRRRCRRIEFTSGDPVPAHLDGEPCLLAAGRHEVRILDGKLLVRTARTPEAE